MAATGLTRRYTADVDSATIAATNNQIVAEMKVAGTLSEVAIQPEAAVASSVSDYRTWTLYNRKTGSGTTVLATLDTSTAGLVDNTERDMVLTTTAANLVVAAGDILEIAETVTGSGVAHSGYHLEVAIAVATA